MGTVPSDSSGWMSQKEPSPLTLIIFLDEINGIRYSVCKLRGEDCEGS